MKLKEHLEKTYEIELMEELIKTSPLYEKSNPKEIAGYYQEMRRLNPKASPWIIFLGMAEEAGLKPPKTIEPTKTAKDIKDNERELARYYKEAEKILSQFPPKERNEIKKAIPQTGPFLPQMSGEKIAKKLHISRQAVSSTLKKGLPKMYQNTKDTNPGMKPWDVLLLIGQKTGMSDDLNKLLKLMPKNIRTEIETDAKRFARK